MKDTPEVITPLKAKLDEFGELLSKVGSEQVMVSWYGAMRQCFITASIPALHLTYCS